MTADPDKLDPEVAEALVAATVELRALVKAALENRLSLVMFDDPETGKRLPLVCIKPFANPLEQTGPVERIGIPVAFILPKDWQTSLVDNIHKIVGITSN
jgi:hypothetical protein